MSKDSENENERLAREWMASEHWGGWRRGMTDGYTMHLCTGSYIDGSGYGFWLGDERSEPLHLVHRNSRYPDLDHTGTRAFLLEDVRRAWMDAGSVLDVRYGPASFLFVAIGADDDRPEFRGHTETGTLISALRAAPEKTK